MCNATVGVVDTPTCQLHPPPPAATCVMTSSCAPQADPPAITGSAMAAAFLKTVCVYNHTGMQTAHQFSTAHLNTLQNGWHKCLYMGSSVVLCGL
jgi:hypothetical protein